MKTRVRIVFILMAALSLPAHGQFSRSDATRRSGAVNPSAPTPGRVDGGSVYRGTFGLSWETRVEPPDPAMDGGFETRTVGGAGAIHRVMLDRVRRTYFGYDILVETVKEAGGYRVTLSPLAMTPETIAQLLPGQLPEWTPMPQPRFPAPMIVQNGDTLVLDVLVNSATGQKVVDRLTVEDPSGTGTRSK